MPTDYQAIVHREHPEARCARDGRTWAIFESGEKRVRIATGGSPLSAWKVAAMMLMPRKPPGKPGRKPSGKKRVSLLLTEDAHRIAKSLAQEKQLSFGDAVSVLIVDSSANVPSPTPKKKSDAPTTTTYPIVITPKKLSKITSTTNLRPGSVIRGPLDDDSLILERRGRELILLSLRDGEIGTLNIYIAKRRWRHTGIRLPDLVTQTMNRIGGRP